MLHGLRAMNNSKGMSAMPNACKTAIAAGMLCAAVTALAGEFDNYDAMALAQGKRVETDCSITWRNPKDGMTYCFANARNQFMFMQNAKTFVPRAQRTFDAN